MIKIFKELDKFNNILYYDEPHKYYINDIPCISGTTLLHKFAPPFNSDEISKSISIKKGIPQDVILADWLASGVKGTVVHDYIENILSNKIFRYPIETVLSNPEFNGVDPVRVNFDKIIPLVHKFKDDIKGRLIPIKSEFVVGDADYGICGMMDQVFYNVKADELQIWDWKTNKKIARSNYFGKLYRPVAHLSNCEYDLYSLQLALYKHIIEKNTSLRFGRSYLTWFHENNDSYEVIECANRDKEIIDIINSYLSDE